MNQNKIFILYALNIKKRTMEKWKELFEICKIQHPNWRKNTINDFIEFEKEWNQIHDFDTFEAGYFLDEEIAIKYAKENMADINESGSYPYIAIVPRVINCMYPDSHDEKITVLHYIRDLDKYKIITADKDENVIPIIKHYNPLHLDS